MATSPGRSAKVPASRAPITARPSRLREPLLTLLQFSTIMGVVMWAGIFWRRANVAGAWAAVIALLVPWMVFGPVGGMARRALPELPDWIGMYGTAQYVPQLMACYLPAGLFALVSVTLITPPPSRKQVDDFYMLLKTPVGE